MKRLAAFAILVLSACQPGVPTAPSNGQTIAVPANLSAASGNMTPLLNAARAQQGRGAITQDVRLTRAAQAHAQDMLANDYFSHAGRNGSSFSDRARAAGYPCAAAENIAFGQTSEAAVMDAWMTLSGHRRNILLADATEFGIGRAGDMWVLVMGRGC